MQNGLWIPEWLEKWLIRSLLVGVCAAGYMLLQMRWELTDMEKDLSDLKTQYQTNEESTIIWQRQMMGDLRAHDYKEKDRLGIPNKKFDLNKPITPDEINELFVLPDPFVMRGIERTTQQRSGQ